MNELYIDLECLPEYRNSPDARRLRNSPEFQKELERVREADRVDSEAVVKTKRTMLDFAYRQFLTDNYTGS